MAGSVNIGLLLTDGFGVLAASISEHIDRVFGILGGRSIVVVWKKKKYDQ
jgi:hypothetical protein